MAPHLCKSNNVVSSGQSESKKTTKFTVKHLILVTNLTLLQRWYIIRKFFYIESIQSEHLEFRLRQYLYICMWICTYRSTIIEMTEINQRRCSEVGLGVIVKSMKLVFK